MYSFITIPNNSYAKNGLIKVTVFTKLTVQTIDCRQKYIGQTSKISNDTHN